MAPEAGEAGHLARSGQLRRGLCNEVLHSLPALSMRWSQSQRTRRREKSPFWSTASPPKAAWELTSWWKKLMQSISLPAERAECFHRLVGVIPLSVFSSSPSPSRSSPVKRFSSTGSAAPTHSPDSPCRGPLPSPSSHRSQPSLPKLRSLDLFSPFS